eukprot:5167058-Alexandrium_andersonii.AAC.1
MHARTHARTHIRTLFALRGGGVTARDVTPLRGADVTPLARSRNQRGSAAATQGQRLGRTECGPAGEKGRKRGRRRE